MRGVTERKQIDIRNQLTDVMFEKRNEIGIWFVGKKDYYISEEDYVKSL